MDLQVIDTNVLVAANGTTDTHADSSCQLTCAQRLQATQDNAALVLDAQQNIMREYQRLVGAGSPNSPAKRFFVWASRTAPRLGVQLTPDATRTFAEFPASEGLRGFDPDDRMFVAAAAVASQSGPTVLANALDNDYAEHQTALREAGIRVDELCPQHIKVEP